MDYSTLSEIAFTFLPWAIALCCYLEAGRCRWQVMFLVVPERSREPLALLVKSNQVPRILMLIWIVFWGPLAMLFWVLARYRELTAGRPSTLDLK
ncbi:hypothetical protein J2J97_32420 (plasmid) [Rhizobium bangladeshense]|uniref:hypothetical protein n=1 Tax=Rhizobium bangladeshense TaxID=1138189 RepID=UPI001A99D2BE|nr:hypothetical protein [Rhizobium bangladeshense]QSY98611.1 hypothetical protein J2J97_32420 [Rhizobium bangladeshense]